MSETTDSIYQASNSSPESMTSPCQGGKSYKDIEHLILNTANNEASSVYGGVSSSVIAVKESPTNSLPSSEWSTSLQTVLEQPPSTLPQRLLLGGMVFCVAFGAWAMLGTVEEVGHARGRLVPQGEVYKIHPEETGKVIQIAVKEGQTVKAGQLIAELDTEIAANEVERLQQTLTADKIQLQQMQGLVEEMRLEAQTRTTITQADIQAQETLIAQANTKAATATELLAQLQSDRAAGLVRLDRLKPLTTKNQDLLEQLQVDVAAAKERLVRLSPLVKQGAIAKEKLFEAEQTLRDRQRAIIQTQLEQGMGTNERLFDAEQTLRDRQRTITQTQEELKQALVEGSRLQAVLRQKQAEGRKAELETQQRIKQLEVEITQLQGKIAETRTLLNSAKAKLVQRFLYAPVNGVVSSLSVHNVGEVVQPGQTIAEMAPKAAPLVLSAFLPNQEAGFVKPGMSVKVKFDAYPYQDYGIVSGKVKSVSPDAKQDERLGAGYQVEVELEHNSAATKKLASKFKAGQTATADIVIRRRHIVDILLKPLKELQKGGIDL